MLSNKTTSWSKKQIEATKRLVKTRLDEGGVKTPRLRLAAITAGIRTNEQAATAEEFLVLYVYVMSALVHHARHGGLTKNDVTRLRGLILAILQFQRITMTSHLSFLYSELYLVLGQIHRRDGDHWAAAWGYEMSAQRGGGEIGAGISAASQAIRALRLGHADRALEGFSYAEHDAALDAANRELAVLGKIRALRLAGQWDAAAVVTTEALRRGDLSEATRHELQWEQGCIDVARSGQCDQLVSMVKKKGSHYQSVYLVEAILWSMCMREKKWQASLPSAATVARRRELNARGLGHFLDSVRVIESAYDATIPLQIRLTDVGDMLGRRSELLTIDRELLLLSAASRWLWRSKQVNLAVLVADEYRGICLRLSNGRTSDTLGLLVDVEVGVVATPPAKAAG